MNQTLAQPLSQDPRRNRKRWRLTSRLSLSFTREGKIYVLVTLGVGFAALNTANNLLFLILGLMLGLIVASGILSELTLRGLSVDRKLPDRVKAKSLFPVELVVKNNKQWASSMAVRLTDQVSGQNASHPQCSILQLFPGQELSTSYQCQLSRRGWTQFDRITLSTCYPFGLFRKKKRIAIPGQTLVHPAPLPVKVPGNAAWMGVGELSVERKGKGQDFYDIREMVPGDDPRRIHWKSTARTNRPTIKETEAEATVIAEVVLDGAPDGPGEAGLDQAERNIAVAYYIVQELLKQGIPVRVITSSETIWSVDDKQKVTPLLDHIALLDSQVASHTEPPVASMPGAMLVGPRAEGRGQGFRIVVPAAWPKDGPAAMKG